MIDEEGQAGPAEQAPSEHYGEALLYDLAKFLTTLSILALGGVLTVTETSDPADVKFGNILLVAVALGLSGSLSALTASIIAVSRFANEKMPAYLHMFMLAALSLLGMGLGSFIYLWLDKLS